MNRPITVDNRRPGRASGNGLYRLTRPLPPGAVPLVKVGERVTPETRLASGHSRRRVLRLPPGGGFKLLKKPGDHLKKGETAAVAEETFGLGLREYVSPLDGVVERISANSTSIVLTDAEEEIRALVEGTVVAVRPGEVHLETAGDGIKGWFGVGDPVAAELLSVGELLTESAVRQELGPRLRGRVVWSSSWMTAAAIPVLARYGAAGLIAAGLDLAPLWELIRPDGPHPLGLGLPTLVITDGFGATRMNEVSRRLLAGAEERSVYLAGPARGRLVFAGPPRAEIVVPAPAALPRARKGPTADTV